MIYRTNNALCAVHLCGHGGCLCVKQQFQWRERAADDASGTIDSSAQYGYTYDHSLFIADNVVTHAVSWEALNSKNIIFGTTFQNNGVGYTLRAPSVGSSAADSKGVTPQSNEWDKILDKDNGYIKNWSGIVSWGQDSCMIVDRAVRGYYSGHFWTYYEATYPTRSPVSVPSLKPLILTHWDLTD